MQLLTYNVIFKYFITLNLILKLIIPTTYKIHMRSGTVLISSLYCYAEFNSNGKIPSEWNKEITFICNMFFAVCL